MEKYVRLSLAALIVASYYWLWNEPLDQSPRFGMKLFCIAMTLACGMLFAMTYDKGSENEDAHPIN